MSFARFFPTALFAACIGSTAHAATFAITGTQTGNNFGVVYTPAPTFVGTVVSNAFGGFEAGSLFFAPFSDDTGGAVYTNPAARVDYAAAGPGSVNGNIITFNDIATTDYFPGSTCSGSCSPLPDGAHGLMDMVLTFSDNDHFTGTAIITYSDMYGGFARTSTFSGVAVPLPAGAWLLGSGLLGLALSRRVSALPRITFQA